MGIEAVIVSVNYGDYLTYTLPLNLPHLDDVVVVTSEGDKETQALCARWGVRCVRTEVHKRHGATFNKSRLINHALAHLSRSDWLLQMDADIVLPPNARKFLADAELDQRSLYGVDRVMCQSWEEWANFREDPTAKADWGWMAFAPRGWPVGARLIHPDYGGYCPIGYFQLWHSSAREKYVLLDQVEADHADVLHAAEFPRSRRVLLPEFFVIHLSDGRRRPGENWEGRTTPRFGPPDPTLALNRAPIDAPPVT